MLSLVIPVYRNEASIAALVDGVRAISEQIADGIEAVFVVDGSPDRSYELLRDALPRQPFRSRLLRLSRNFGAFEAIRAGLEAATGDRFAVMAADLQEPPELIVEMDREMRERDVEVVVGVRKGRDDPTTSRLPAQAFWGLYRRLVMPEIPPGGVDIFACTRGPRDQLVGLQEQHASLVAQLFWLGYRRSYISYDRAPRMHGRSAWTWRKKLSYFGDSVFSFTDLPLKLLIGFGGIIAFLSGAYGLLVLLLRLAGAIEIPGFTALILLLVFFGSAILFAIGIVGMYAWRIYENTKARPLHIVLDVEDIQPPAENDA